MGKVLVLCVEEKWDSPIPKQIISVYGEQLIARTVRQIRKRMNNYPHIISNQKCLRTYSTNYISPSKHKCSCETLNSIVPIWGNDWTMVLMGDVLYSDASIDLIYSQREKFHYHFYGTSHDIFALTFTDNDLIKDALDKINNGNLWDLYYYLSKKPLPESGKGYTGDEDDLHYTYIIDECKDFDSIEEYEEWCL